MVLEHKPAEKLFIDFAGKKPHYMDKTTGEVVECQMFVACLPYSDYSFAMLAASRNPVLILQNQPLRNFASKSGDNFGLKSLLGIDRIGERNGKLRLGGGTPNIPGGTKGLSSRLQKKKVKRRIPSEAPGRRDGISVKVNVAQPDCSTAAGPRFFCYFLKKDTKAMTMRHAFHIVSEDTDGGIERHLGID